jgi:hypothetical protein
VDSPIIAVIPGFTFEGRKLAGWAKEGTLSLSLKKPKGM